MSDVRGIIAEQLGEDLDKVRPAACPSRAPSLTKLAGLNHIIIL